MFSGHWLPVTSPDWVCKKKKTGLTVLQHLTAGETYHLFITLINTAKVIRGRLCSADNIRCFLRRVTEK